ncbi:hypothetical protein FQN54_003366 [Arachnomyces sp. PD_36]|nr:hypothetical protein FQN54_003366 [Arachnomyces sp. PD_36]
MTHNEPVGKDTDNAPEYLITCGFLALISLVLLCLRIYSKLRPEPRLGSSDYFIIAGTLLSLSGYGSGIAAATYGWGHRTPFVSDYDRTVALKFVFAIQIQYTLSVSLIRMSVALSLLRLSMNKVWKGTLWGLLIIQFFTSVGWMVAILAWCRPLRGVWEYVEDTQCWDFKYEVLYGWVTNGIYALMDLAFALMPIKLVWKLRRPLREKILIGILMATGLFATIAACAKGVAFKNFGHGDMLSNGVPTTFYAKIEEQLGIIAACIPCLKVPAERFLRQMGILSERGISTTKPSFVATMSFRYSSTSGNGGTGAGADEDGNETVPLSPIDQTWFSQSSSFDHHSREESGRLSISNDSTYYGRNDVGDPSAPTPPEKAAVSPILSPNRNRHTRSATAKEIPFTAAAVNTTAPLPPLEEPTSNGNPNGMKGNSRGRGRSEPHRMGWHVV